MKQSQAWKALERLTARLLKGNRVSRADDWGRSDTDVKLPDLPHWRIDCKYRSHSFAHHTLMSEIQRKYCDGPIDVPVLVTKERGQKGAIVSMRIEDFAGLLNKARSRF